MMKEVSTPVRTIHPKVLEYIGERYALELLSIASDLRSGEIKPENFKMRSVFWNDVVWKDHSKENTFKPEYLELYGQCGTPCCILGHLRFRLNEPKALIREWEEDGPVTRLTNLFAGHFPSNPEMAADAIENYVFDFSIAPWQKAGYSPYY